MFSSQSPLRIFNPRAVQTTKLPAYQHNNKAAPLFLVMMRINLKVALLCICTAVLLVTLSLWSRCGVVSRSVLGDAEHLVDAGSIAGRIAGTATPDNQEAHEIDCHINGEYTIGCRKEGDEVYIPFSFLSRYFEVYGKLASYDGFERFEWAHSYGKVNHPKGKYSSRGVFMYFENYNVEVRERVKCVSGTEGVPVSTQWESQGYYYPTQIAQFGLSHYSKNLTEPDPRRKVLEDADRVTAKWSVPTGASITRAVDPETGSKVLKFSTPETLSTAVTLKLEHVLDFVLSMNINLKDNGSVSVVLQNREKKELFNLHYITSDVMISIQGENIYHGIGLQNGWRRVTRDLVVDLQKGLVLVDKPRRKPSRSKLKIVSVSLHGMGMLDNLTLSSSEHMAQFYDAARWFVKHQDSSTGGWANPVKRRVAPGFADLVPGWYSAMGQGHAISVLSRAYHHSGEHQYLRAAIAGLRPFRIPSWQGGVLATFLGKYAWYEEYPTRPASFVLNGFIYSLLGLYDLKSIAPAGQAKEASVLLDQGMASLKGMLLLFDTGSGTSYDLRHFTLGIAPNLARWDYHATHVNQLLLLATIDSDPIIQNTAERWMGYMTGKKAAHN